MGKYGTEENPNDRNTILIDRDWDIWLQDDDSADATWTMLGEEGDGSLSKLSREKLDDQYGPVVEFVRAPAPVTDGQAQTLGSAL